MLLGVAADSHKNLEYLKTAGRILKAEHAEEIIHLGDDYDDAEILNDLELKVTRVPGVFSSYYKDPKIPNRIVKNYNGWRVLLTHSPTSHENDIQGDIKPEEITAKKGVDIVLHAHTHIPRIDEEKGIIWVNPGHLKIEDKKGAPASFALIDFEIEKVKIKIIDLNKQETMKSREFIKP